MSYIGAILEKYYFILFVKMAVLDNNNKVWIDFDGLLKIVRDVNFQILV